MSDDNMSGQQFNQSDLIASNVFFLLQSCSLLRGVGVGRVVYDPQGREFETDREHHPKSSGRASGLKALQRFSREFGPREHRSSPIYGKKECYLKEMIADLVKRKPSTSSLLLDGAFRFTPRSILQELRKCSTLHGDLILNHHGTSYGEIDESVRTIDFYNLKFLTRIYGSVTLYLPYYPNITSLDFLRSLREINNPRGSFLLYNSHVEALNLSPDIMFNVSKVMILGNGKLCYLERFSRNFGTSVTFFIRNNRNLTDCLAEAKTCSSACASTSGCLGPGNRRCAQCANVRAGLECVAECHHRRGFYLAQAGDRQCSLCHPECVWTCSGPGRHHCDACRSTQHGGICVPCCSNESSLKNSAHHCQPEDVKTLVSVGILVVLLVIAFFAILVLSGYIKCVSIRLKAAEEVNRRNELGDAELLRWKQQITENRETQW